MAQAKILPDFGNVNFVPGYTVAGKVAWHTGGEAVTKAELRLFYYTDGKGTRDVKVVHRAAMPAVGVNEGEAFSFAVPAGPFSFSGKLVSVRWALEFVLEPVDCVERLEICVSPTAQEIDLHAHGDGDGDGLTSAQKKTAQWKARAKKFAAKMGIKPPADEE